MSNTHSPLFRVPFAPAFTLRTLTATSLRRTISTIAVPVFYAACAAVALTSSNNASAALIAEVGTSATAAGSTKSSLPLSQVERDWLAARAAFDRRDIAGLASAKERFQTRSEFPLSPYVTFWWLDAQLAQNAQNVRVLQSAIEGFSLEYADTPFVDQLRRDYLRSLGKIEDWPLFAEFQSKYTGDDNEVACQRLRYRSTTAEAASAAVEARVLLLAAKSAAAPCYDLFEKLVASKVISEEDLWQRARALFDAGQLADARRTVALIPGLRSDYEAATAAVNLDARHFLLKSAGRASDRPQVELTLFAISRLARSNAEAAALWLEKNEARLPKNAQSHAWAQIAHQAALQLQPEALAWFGKALANPEFKLSDAQAGWLARAALRATASDPSQWATVRRAINQMSEQERREPTWRYWLARSMATSALPADLAAARAARETLAWENHFYGLMAAEELGVAKPPSFQAFAISEPAIARITERQGVKRAFALYRLAELKPDAKDLRGDALREWVAAMRNADDETLLAGAEAARRQGLPDRAINTAERTKLTHDFSQRYPLPHRDTLQVQAANFGVDEAWVYGLIRQESRFMADARSSVGAAGLMQLMPATAKWAAQQVGIKNYTSSRVADVDVNLSLGTFYLKHVLDDLGHPVLATAAYNAGPGRARRWRASTPLEGAIYAESIPFNETRDYVKKVMLNKWYYGYRIYGKSPPLSQLMGSIPAKSAGAAGIAATIAAAQSIAPTPDNSGSR